jgi:hypothetical protein
MVHGVIVAVQQKVSSMRNSQIGVWVELRQWNSSPWKEKKLIALRRLSVGGVPMAVWYLGWRDISIDR